jgi:hypothetical protein
VILRIRLRSYFKNKGETEAWQPIRQALVKNLSAKYAPSIASSQTPSPRDSTPNGKTACKRSLEVTIADAAKIASARMHVTVPTHYIEVSPRAKHLLPHPMTISQKRTALCVLDTCEQAKESIEPIPSP